MSGSTEAPCPKCGVAVHVRHMPEVTNPPTWAYECKRCGIIYGDEPANRFTDSRGEILRLDFHGQKVHLLFTKAGCYRSGDFHPHIQVDHVISGSAVVTRHLGGLDIVSAIEAGGTMLIGSKVPHLFHFSEDTVMLESWDGPLVVEYYEPYRKIVRESMEGKDE